MIARDKECEDAEHRWIFGKLVNEAITSDMQALEVKFDEEVMSDQEVSIADMENILTGELCSVRGSSKEC